MRVQPPILGYGKESALELNHPSVLRSEQAGVDPSEAAIHFRAFAVYPGSRTLFRGGCPVALGSRAFDLLMALLKARGSVLGKDEILRHVWPSTLVEESNLRFQMACLRKALGKDRDLIKTIPGRGYLFATETGSELSDRYSLPDASSRGEPTHNVHNSPSLDDSTSMDLRGDHLHPGIRSDVVLIDDDGDTRVALQSLLRSAGLNVESFASVQAFRDAPPIAPPRCMILDVWMPGQSGLDFYAELAEADACLPVIFISGHADVHMSVRAMKAGATDFLTKPVRYRDLLDAIQAAIEPHKA